MCVCVHARTHTRAHAQAHTHTHTTADALFKAALISHAYSQQTEAAYLPAVPHTPPTLVSHK